MSGKTVHTILSTPFGYIGATFLSFLWQFLKPQLQISLSRSLRKWQLIFCHIRLWLKPFLFHYRLREKRRNIFVSWSLLSLSVFKQVTIFIISTNCTCLPILWTWCPACRRRLHSNIYADRLTSNSTCLCVFLVAKILVTIGHCGDAMRSPLNSF